jgi:sensor histidine kinase YesM
MSVKMFFQNRIVQHALFWIAIAVLSVSQDFNGPQSNPFAITLAYYLCYFISQILLSYILAYYLLPKFYIKKKHIAFITLTIVTVYILSVLSRCYTVYIVEPLVRTPPFEQESIIDIFTDIQYIIFRYSFPIFFASAIFMFVKLFVDYKKDKEKILLLNKEKSDVELKTLKAQLNPHFLFNTLNNIYSLSIINSSKTPIAIGKLSEILDYVLYRCNSDFVTISNEIELLKNYIELEKLRYDERLEIHFKTEIKTENTIPPLILLSLVENAFKHGAGEDSGSPKIWIDLKTEKSNTVFNISNTILETPKTDKKGNIGLINIQKQLDLLYGKSYSLRTIVENNIFKATLIINTNPI